MEGPAYLFAFTDKDYNFYQVINGVVSLATPPDSYFLESSPVGWEDITIEINRNIGLWGLERQTSSTISFVNDGALILKDTFYKKGSEADCYLTIVKQELYHVPGVEYGFWYRQIFRGAVDFSTFQHTGPKVTVKTLEDGLPKFIKANENTLYEFPMNVSDAVMVKFDGINLHNKVNFNGTATLEFGAGTTGFFNLGAFQMVLIGAEGDSYGLEYLGSNQEAVGNVDGEINHYVETSDNWFIHNYAQTAITFTITGKKKFTATEVQRPGDDAIDIYFISSISKTRYSVVTNLLPTQGSVYEYNYTFTVTLNAGESLFAIRFFHNIPTHDGAEIIILWDEVSNDKVESITRRPTTYVPHFTGQYLLNQLASKVTDGVFTADISPMLVTDKNILFTCGNAIRGIVDGSGNSLAVMQMSLAKLFQFYDCRRSAGIIERLGKVLLDTKEGLVDTTNYIDLGVPAYQPTITITSDYAFNEVENGYPEIRNDVGALNGNEEFNTRVRWSTGTVNKPSKLDKVSQIKASCYEQEKIRTTLFDKSTTDYKNDNDVYANYVNGTLVAAGSDYPAHYTFDRSLNAGATGLIEPASIWNLPLSPKRHLLLNGSFFRSSTYECDNLTMKFISGDKNTKVVAGGITENADVLMSAFNAPFFKPIIFLIGVRAPEDLISLLEINPLQVYRFYFQGQYWYAIANRVSINPSNKKEQQYELLAVPTNNFTDLIKYFG